MSRLLIKQVKYIGANYIYESPILSKGINIIEGENGGGKTTFSSLIYFCLGGNVPWFKSDGKDDYREITDDNSNYAELSFIVDDIPYISTRYFYKNEINVVSPNDVLSLPINRSKDKKFTFSDWLLGKLEIKVVDIYQGSEFWKINFYDLMRLFYYDQLTTTTKIYKSPDNENFITDSLIIRKAIFEILMGNSFEEYYQSIADYRKALNEQATIKALIQNFEVLNIDSDNLFEGRNSLSLNDNLQEGLSQLRRLEEYRGSIKGNANSSTSNTELISNKRDNYTKVEDNLIRHKKRKGNLLYDLNRVQRLRSNLILEVTHLKKIMITNEELGLFSPETCPNCLKKVVKEENKCICGNDVSDEQFQKFFYTKEDYFGILKSKQKNIETVDSAMSSYEEDIEKIRHQIALHENRLRELKGEINGLLKGKRIIKNAEIDEVNDKILSVEKEIAKINQQIKVEENREGLEQRSASMAIVVEEKRRDMKIKGLQASESMDSVIRDFNYKYDSLMKVALEDCKSARISSEDYMPVINSGSYTEASSNVPKRLMYFFTLLHMSLVSNIKHPKFLLIDTPENIGIDDDKLLKAISLIKELGDENTKLEDFQIILTTGKGKYPEEFENNVFERVSKKNRLLKPRIFDIGA